jgi:hypothetical protein
MGGKGGDCRKGSRRGEGMRGEGWGGTEEKVGKGKTINMMPIFILRVFFPHFHLDLNVSDSFQSHLTTT